MASKSGFERQEHEGERLKQEAQRLAMEKTPESFNRLIRLLSHPSMTVKIWAAAALEEHKNPKATPHLIRELKHKNQFVRMSAASALGESGDSRAIIQLVRTLDDQNEFVRNRAHESIVKIGKRLRAKYPKPSIEHPAFPFRLINPEKNPRAFGRLVKELADKRHGLKPIEWWKKHCATLGKIEAEIKKI